MNIYTTITALLPHSLALAILLARLQFSDLSLLSLSVNLLIMRNQLI